MPSIHVQSGVEEGSTYGFPPGDVVFIVGRAPNSGIVITDPLVSRQHCRIERINGRYRAVDLGSHNGTAINDQRMPQNSTREISFGDVVRIGETELLLREEAPDDEGELAGRRLAGYQLVKRIGSGGMGEVYRAVQVALGRPVAIKILSPDLTEDRTFVDRFMTEARAAGRLNHPNVAQVHEVGESDGIYYYSMEFLGGGSVQEKIRGGRSLPLPEALKVVSGAARALDYAEKHGVIHCDVKPDNLMLTEEGEVRLADLGIARMVRSAAEKVKQEGGVLGSPHYMAPEQARGEPIDRRVDIYALGATFYRMIAGRTPFTGNNAREIMEKQVYEEPPGLRTLNPEIPQSVCRVIAQMMKKNPDKRYQSARELLADIEKLQEELAPRKEPPSGPGVSRTMRRVRRPRRPAIYALLAVGLACLTAGGALALALVSGRERDAAAERLRAQARQAEERGDLAGARDLYLQLRQAAPPDGPLHKAAAEAVERLEKLISRDAARAAVEREWQQLEAAKQAARSPEDFGRLSGEFAAFATRHPYSPRTAAARLAEKTALAEYEGLAAKAVEAHAPQAEELAAACRFSEMAKGWRALAERFADTPAGRTAAERAEAAAGRGTEELGKARAEADKALAENRLDEVLKPLQRLAAADESGLRKSAAQAIEEFKARIETERDRRKEEAERQSKLAACRALRAAAAELALAYDYAGARGRFLEAEQACRRADLDEEAAAVRKLGEAYWEERRLFDRLYDFSRDGGVSAAIAALAGGARVQVTSAGAAGLIYSRGMGQTATVEWKDVPAATVFDLLRRPPALTPEERVVLARFALSRSLWTQAREVLDKLIEAQPDRKAALAPLIEAAEKGAGGKGDGAPAPGGEAPPPGGAEAPKPGD